MFYKISVLKNFDWNALVLESFFINITSLKAVLFF